MMTLGIDVAKRSHTATLLGEDGAPVFQGVTIGHSREGVDAFLALLGEHAPPGGALVGMEATGHYWKVLFQHVFRAGCEVRLLNPILTSAKRSGEIRGGKDDGPDSRRIAEVLRKEGLRASVVPEGDAKALREMGRLRFRLSKAATAEKQRLEARLDVAFPEWKGLFSDVFGAASLAALLEFPTAAHVARADSRRLAGVLDRASRGRLGRDKARELKAAARASFALDGEQEALAEEIRFLVERIRQYAGQIARVDKRCQSLFPEEQAVLRTASGIGPAWAATILGEVLPFFDPALRNGGKKFVAAAGIDVRPFSSGQMKTPGRMSKRGSKYLRTAAMQAAAAAVNFARDPALVAMYERQKARGKHHLVALSHVARKILHIVFALLKTGRPYSPATT